MSGTRRLLPAVSILLLGQIISPVVILADPASAEYIMLFPKRLYVGTQSSASISSFSSQTGKPVDRQVVLTLVDPNQKGDGLVIFEGRTGPDGHLIARFDVPQMQKGLYKVVLTSPGRGESVSGEVTVADALTLLIETDKPIYKPGQTIHGRVLALNTELKPVAIPLNVSISDAKGVKVYRKELFTDAYGVASFDLLLANELNLGTWKILANAAEGMSTIDIRVEKYVLPKFDVDVTTAKDWFLVDEEIVGEVKANYFFGKPVDGMVEIRAYKYLADWEEFATFRAKLRDGAARFEIPEVNYLAGTLGAGGMGSVMLNVSVVDGAGHEEKESLLLRICQSPIVVQIIPSSETVKPGLPLDILLVTETPGGDPLDRVVQVDATYYLKDGSTTKETRRVPTFRGLGTTDLNVPDTCTSASIAAQVSDGSAKSEISLQSVYSPGGYFVHIKQISRGEVRVGDTVTFEVLSTAKRTVYYDVVAGGRTVFSGFTTGRYVSFTATPSMVPKAKLVAYVLNPNMEVSADSLPFDVAMEPPVGLSASFSSETSAPGGTVTLDLKSSAGVATMIGVSIVDESVYALNEGRLNLKQIFDELEKIFMEPQAEAHPQGEMFWWGPMTKGAKEIFEEAGVQVIASSSVNVPQGTPEWVIRGKGGGPWILVEVADQAQGSQPSQPTSGAQGLAEVQRVRQFFPETWYWNPSLLTDRSGHAAVQLTVPDTITTWRLHAVSSSAEGIGMVETSLKVFQDFFVEPDLPYAVTRGEQFPVLVQIYNYLERSQTVQVEITKDDWFQLLDDRVKIVAVPGNSVASVAFTIEPKKIGQFKIEITARTAERADAVRRDILVEAEGTPREIVENGFITQTEPRSLDLSLPDGIVEGSGRVLLSITPSLVGQTISGMEDLLGMPFGCGEQNMMFMAPDLEILRYLDATDQVVPEVRAKAELYLITGYQRELTFRRKDGSFSAFGESDKEGSLWLTAFVLDVFSEAREVLSIDEVVLKEAASWIESLQNANGSWSPFGFVCHQEMMGGLRPEAKSALTAFVAIALTDYGSGNQDSLRRAVSYLEAYGITDDVYSLALTALLLQKVGSPKAEAALLRLLALAQTDENGMYWAPGRERANAVETTAYAALALMLAGRSEAEPAVRWIACQRNSLGGFCSTQDTVMAMKALMTAARLQSRNINSTIDVVVDGSTIAKIKLTEDNFDVLQVLQMPAGAKRLELVMAGEGKVMFQLAKRFNVPGEVFVNPEFMLEVKYNTTSAEVDDIVDVYVRVRYDGPYNSTGMTILDIAVPTGFAPVQSSLDEVVSQGLATRVEVAGRKVIFYIDDLERGRELRIGFKIRALFPVRALGGTSRAYSYYKPDVRTEAAGQKFVVSGEVASKFGPEPAEPGPAGGTIGTVRAPTTILPLAMGLILVGCLAVLSLRMALRRR